VRTSRTCATNSLRYRNNTLNQEAVV
jgi:hypothetical protein